MAETPLLEIDAVVAGYEGPDILRGVSLSIPQGQLITIVGPNGHGKTTLLRAISGLVRCRAGRILLSGREISSWAPHLIAAAGIAHVPQGDLLFPDMSVAENLMMGAYTTTSRAIRRIRLDEVYALFPKLAQRRNQLACTLSGGERRMVGIGRGLMMGGDLLLLDEPSLGLAPIAIENIFTTIAAMRAAGRTLLLVEENPARVVDIADRIHLFDDGRIIWSGMPRDLLNRSELLETYLGG